MKKSQLKALIREVIEEVLTTPVEVWEVYERDGNRVIAYLNQADAKDSDVFENGYDHISKTTVQLSSKDLAFLKQNGYIWID